MIPSLVLALSIGLSTSSSSPAESNEDTRPNIVFFLSDDHRADLLGSAGHPILKTPNLDQLAARGTRFESMFVTTSICAASRATLLTGLYERGHRFTFGTPPLDPLFCATSYPARLKAEGYRTGFVGKFGVKASQESIEAMFDDWTFLNRNPYFKTQPDGTKRHLSEIAADHAIEFLRSQSSETPFCLSLSFNAPHAEDSDKENHYPWPKAVDGLYDDLEIPLPHLSDPEIFESIPEVLQDSMNRDRWYWRWDTPEKYQKNVKAYFRMLSGVDHVIGRLLDELERLGFDDNTVVIFSGDNGYYLGSRGFAGKWSHYEESLRVPLIIADPRLPKTAQGRVVDPVVLNVDVAPTILEVAGITPPEHYQGRSLTSLLDQSAPSDWRTDFFCEHLFNNARIPKWEGIRGARWVYARYFEEEPPFEFLHDLETDPQQLQNCADDPSSSAILDELRERTETLRKAYSNPIVELD